MNYYKFNIGDYAAATRHLTMIEHGAYRLLLDVYYTSEQPLPSDARAAARKAGARSKDEIAAVEVVLNEFFTLTPDGWVQPRCDAEIAGYQAKAETNRAVGKRGGRPKKETKTVSDGNPEITQTVSENNPQETLNKNHKPRTINQEPIKNTSACARPPDGVPDPVWADFQKLRRAKKAPITETAIDGIRREADRAGMPLGDVLAMCCERGWTGFKADWLEQKSQQRSGSNGSNAETFAERDRENGMRRWEQMTGQVHPDRRQKTADVIDVAQAVEVFSQPQTRTQTRRLTA